MHPDPAARMRCSQEETCVSKRHASANGRNHGQQRCPNKACIRHAHSFPALPIADRARAPTATAKALGCPLVVRSAPHVLVEVSLKQTFKSARPKPKRENDNRVLQPWSHEQRSPITTTQFCKNASVVEGEGGGPSGCEVMQETICRGKPER